MPRPESRPIKLTIDGREVEAPENMMLVDAAKLGDVEIPVFCYEPKLGQPVGACRMCLVEIEGIPKLQTGCSTPVKDGMVVHTQSPRAKTAQEAVVEFLLVNHPLDCPVCDKGGECPLQDIAFGWGAGTSRFVEPKRHFVKPLELSRTIAIDRERCILCYRCVRFSQEISEDYQLVLLERGAHSYVSTFDGTPYVAPFSGNIVELCPVGALTSRNYRFRARPWDVEDAGSVCTLCAAQCNVTLTVRDERVLRVLAREHPEVDDGWLCDRGRFAYPGLGQGRVTEPLLRDGGELRPVSWERALQEAADRLKRTGVRTGAIAGGGATNEEGFLLARLMREGLGAPHIDSRVAGSLPLELHRALAEPALQAKVSDLEFAHVVLVLDVDLIEDAAILDLRLRKGVRRHGMKLIHASAAELLGESSVQALATKLVEATPSEGTSHDRERPGGHTLKGTSKQAGAEIVVLWGERLTAGPDGARAAQALLDLAATLGIAETDGAGLLEIPAQANGRGLREAGVLPNAGPGLSQPDEDGRDARGIAEGLIAGELSCLYLLGADPLGGASEQDRPLWEQALGSATTVISHASLLTDAIREHADIVFPAGAYPEKEGTIVHPDGRIQRLRPAVAQLGESRAEWQIIADVAARLGFDLDVLTGGMASQQLLDAVPRYAGLTLEQIGSKGVRPHLCDVAAAS
jgi:NADH-quinone oxidoreductase subunit G